MNIDPAAILALLSEQATRIAALEDENASLREQVAIASRSQQAD